MKVDEVKVLMYGMSCSLTLAQPPCITQYCKDSLAANLIYYFILLPIPI